jgi:hypothetical protein
LVQDFQNALAGEKKQHSTIELEKKDRKGTNIKKTDGKKQSVWGWCLIIEIICNIESISADVQAMGYLPRWWRHTISGHYSELLIRRGSGIGG